MAGSSATFSIGIKTSVDLAGVKQLKQELEQVKQLAQGGQISGLGKSEIDAATKSANELEKAIDKAFDADLNTINIQKFNQSLQNSGTSLKTIYNDLSATGSVGEKAFLTATKSLYQMNTAVKQTDTLMKSLADQFVNVIRYQVVNRAVNSITSSIQQAYYFAKDLDTSLTNIRIVTGKSADEMANFAVQANNAAKALAVSTEDYVEGSLIYYQQGLDSKTVSALTDVTAKTSNVTGQSMAEVSEQLTAVWNGYQAANQAATEGMQVYEEYVDKMAAVGASTASDLEEITSAMSKVAPTANMLGVTFDQLTAQVATIVSTTRQAPETIGTALKSIYARISDINSGAEGAETSLGDYTKAMAEMGFSVLDSEGKLRDMGEVMTEIGNSWENLTREQQISLAQTMAGTRQYSNLIALFDSWDEYQRALNISMSSSGTLEQQQGIYMDSMRAKCEQLNAALEDFQNNLNIKEFVTPFISVLTTIVQGVADITESLGGLSGIVPMLIGLFGNLLSNNIGVGIEGIINKIRLLKQELLNNEEILKGSLIDQGIAANSAGYERITSYYKEMSQYINLMSQGEKEYYNQLVDTQVELEKIKIDLRDLANTEEKRGARGQLAGIGLDPKDAIKMNSNETDVLELDENKVDNFVNKINLLRKTVEDMKADLNDTPTAGMFNGYISTLENAGIKVDELKIKLAQAGNDPEALKNIVVQLENITNYGEAAKQKMTALLQETNNNAARQKLSEQMGLRQAIADVTSVTSSMISLTSIVSQLSSIGDIFNNKNLSESEKIFQTISKLLPTILLGVQAFSKLGNSGMGKAFSQGFNKQKNDQKADAQQKTNDFNKVQEHVREVEGNHQEKKKTQESVLRDYEIQASDAQRKAITDGQTKSSLTRAEAIQKQVQEIADSTRVAAEQAEKDAKAAEEAAKEAEDKLNDYNILFFEPDAEENAKSLREEASRKQEEADAARETQRNAEETAQRIINANHDVEQSEDELTEARNQASIAGALQNAAVQALTTSEGLGAAATTFFKNAVTGLNAAFKANPIGFVITAITTLITVLTTAKKIADKLRLTKDGQKEQIDQDTEAYQEEVEKLKEIEEQRESNKKSIKELESLGRGLTDTEAERLAQLKAENIELQRQLDSEKQIAQQKAETLVNDYKKYGDVEKQGATIGGKTYYSEEEYQAARQELAQKVQGNPNAQVQLSYMDAAYQRSGGFAAANQANYEQAIKVLSDETMVSLLEASDEGRKILKSYRDSVLEYYQSAFDGGLSTVQEVLKSINLDAGELEKALEADSVDKFRESLDPNSLRLFDEMMKALGLDSEHFFELMDGKTPALKQDVEEIAAAVQSVSPEAISNVSKLMSSGAAGDINIANIGSNEDYQNVLSKSLPELQQFAYNQALDKLSNVEYQTNGDGSAELDPENYEKATQAIQDYADTLESVSILQNEALAGTSEWYQALFDITQLAHEAELAPMYEEAATAAKEFDDAMEDVSKEIRNVVDESEEIEIGVKVSPKDLGGAKKALEKLINADYEIAVKVVAQGAEDLKSIQDRVDSIQDVADIIEANGGIISWSDFEKLSQQYPELMRNVQQYGNGAIQVDNEVYQNWKAKNEAQLEAQRQTAADDLRAQGEAMVKKGEALLKYVRQVQDAGGNENKINAAVSEVKQALDADDAENQVATSASAYAEVGENADYTLQAVLNDTSMAMHQIQELIKQIDPDPETTNTIATTTKLGATSASSVLGKLNLGSDIEAQGNDDVDINLDDLNEVTETANALIDAGNTAIAEADAMGIKRPAGGDGKSGGKGSGGGGGGSNPSVDLSVDEVTDEKEKDVYDETHTAARQLELDKKQLEQLDKVKSSTTGPLLVRVLKAEAAAYKEEAKDIEVLIEKEKEELEEKKEKAKQDELYQYTRHDLETGKAEEVTLKARFEFDENGSIINYDEVMQEAQELVDTEYEAYHQAQMDKNAYITGLAEKGIVDTNGDSKYDENDEGYSAALAAEVNPEIERLDKVIDATKANYDNAKKMVEDASTFVSETEELQDSMFEHASELLEARLNAIKAQVDAVKESVQEVEDLFDALGDLIGDIGIEDEGLFSSIGDLLGYVKAIKGLTADDTNFFGQIFGFTEDDSFTDKIQKMMKSLNSLDMSKWESFGTVATEVFQMMSTDGPAAMLEKLESLLPIFTGQMDINSEAAQQLISSLGLSAEAFGTLGAAATAVAGAFSLVLGILTAIFAIWQAIRKIIKKAAEDDAKALVQQYKNQEEALENVLGYLDTYKSLINKIYGDSIKANDSLRKYYSTQAELITEQMNNAYEQIDVLQEKMANAITTDEYETYYNQYIEALEQLNQSFEDMADNVWEKYKLKVEDAVEELTQTITGMTSEAWTQMQDMFEIYSDSDYYDEVDRGLNTILLDMKYKNAMENQSEKVQKRINKLREAEIKRLNELKAVNEDDLAISEKKLAVLQAEIALEESQSQKTGMTLVKDANGNWTYQYTTDEDAVNEAQEEYTSAALDYYDTAKAATLKTKKSAFETINNITDIEKEAEEQGWSAEYIKEKQDAYFDQLYKQINTFKSQQAETATAAIAASDLIGSNAATESIKMSDSLLQAIEDYKSGKISYDELLAETANSKELIDEAVEALGDIDEALDSSWFSDWFEKFTDGIDGLKEQASKIVDNLKNEETTAIGQISSILQKWEDQGVLTNASSIASTQASQASHADESENDNWFSRAWKSFWSWLGFDSGGYTGTWTDAGMDEKNGKLAVLHQKELVLNASDTENIMEAVKAVRDYDTMNSLIDRAVSNMNGATATSIGTSRIVNNSNTTDTENKFYINANFPNATNVSDIQEAILTLPNIATQTAALRK